MNAHSNKTSNLFDFNEIIPVEESNKPSTNSILDATSRSMF